MAFTRLAFRKNWTKEEDFPTYQDSEAQVRADLQYHPDALRDYINQELLTSLEGRAAAGTLGAADGNGTAATIQTVLDTHAEKIAKLAEDLAMLASGGVPSVVKSTEVVFAVGSWATASGGVTLTIPRSDHGRNSAAFGYNLYQLVDGTYRGGTWGGAATRVVYHTGGSITLMADAPYSGKIVFFGM